MVDAAASPPLEIPRVEPFNSAWIVLSMIVQGVGLGVAVALIATGGDQFALSFVVSGVLMVPLARRALVYVAIQRRIRTASEVRDRLLGSAGSSAIHVRSTTPPITFLGNPELLEHRKNRMPVARFLAVQLLVFGFIPSCYGTWFLSTSWKEKELVALGYFIACVIVGLTVVVGARASNRRDDADLERVENWRRKESTGSVHDSAEVPLWPLPLFAVDWRSTIASLGDSWRSSGLATADRETEFAALERAVGWLQQLDLLPQERRWEGAIHGAALRRVAWRLVSRLDPTIGGAGALAAAAPNPSSKGGIPQ